MSDIAVDRGAGAVADEHEGEILRYRRPQRIIHAVMASSFLILLITGLALVWSPLAFIAAGGWSRYLHRIAAVGFMSVPVLYLVFDRRGAKEVLFDSFRPDSHDWQWALHMGRYALGRTKDMPSQGKLNAGQKLHHSMVIIFSGVIVASGLLLWLAKSSLSVSQLSMAAAAHDIAMLVLTLLLVGHIFFTFVYGAWSSMGSGYVDRLDMELEHADWVDELDSADRVDELDNKEVAD